MFRPGSPLLKILPLIVALGVIGFALGVHKAGGTGQAPAVAAPAAISVGGMTLEYPASWEAATVTAGMPRLPFAHAVVLSPAGRTSEAGLIAGVLPQTAHSPLPAGLLASLGHAPQAAVVEQLGAQAYRYSMSGIWHGGGTVELYVDPARGEDADAVACYAAAGAGTDLQACRQIVAGITQAGAAVYTLTTEPRYAASLAAAIATLQRAWRAGRAQLTHAGSPAHAAAVAERLAASFTAALESLSALEPPDIAASAQAGLSEALRAARAAYRVLAAAAAAGQPSAYNSARARVGRAELGVDRALEQFALYGYRLSR